MKKINLTLLLVGLFSSFAWGQIEVLTEDPVSIAKKQARIKSQKPFWLGVKGASSIHLDSSSNFKVGIGTWYQSNSTILSERQFFEHAKLHIRHEGGPGSEFTNQKGPHLLLDEATSDKAAVIRFRQSTIDTDGSALGVNSLVIGDRYWDLRGFANGASLASDEFRLINSGATEDLVTIDGDGNFKLSGEGSTRLEIKGPVDNNPVKLEFGAVGTASNEGRLWYNTSTDVMQIFSGGAVSLTLDNGRVGVGSVNPGDSKLYVDGYSTLGDHAQAPKIKTWYGEAGLPSNYNAVTNHNILPVVKGRILSCSVMVTNSDGDVVTSNVYNSTFDSFFYYSINGTTISLHTDDVYYSPKVLGATARIFVTYTD